MGFATGFVLPCLAVATLLAGPKIEEKVRNERVQVREVVLAPGETENIAGDRASVTVYWTNASFRVTAASGPSENIVVKEGESLFSPAAARSVNNTGNKPLRYVRTEFLGGGSSETWGKTGLAPDYKLLIENRYARVYDIRIPAHSREPQHTHHDRVVVCLSGAYLKHLYPDGHEEPSTLATGQTAWRRGGTHIGENLGNTPLWVIAIEPK